MMDRRTACIRVAAGAWLALPRRGLAQAAADRVYRVGVLRPSAAFASANDVQGTGIAVALREIGYVEGRNLVLDQRFGGGDVTRLPTLARELVLARPEVIVAIGQSAVRAARVATPTIPIVMFGNFDPVAAGLVTNLARPGGTLTGILIAPDGSLGAKRLELLKAAVPQARRIAHLIPDDPAFDAQLREMREAAAALGIALAEVKVAGGDYERAFAEIVLQRPAALVVASNQFFLSDRRTIIELAARHKLPAMYEWREQVADGGLMTYSTSLTGLYRRVASQVDRILKGAAPGDLPIERPAKFDLVINLKTARALGLTIPPALLLRADEVIE